MSKDRLCTGRRTAGSCAANVKTVRAARRVVPGDDLLPDGDELVPRGDARHHRRVMKRIQEPFEASRARAWPQVIRRLERLKPDGLLLDLAAGNGRHSIAAAGAGHDVVAVDVARGLLASLRARWVPPGGRGTGTVHCVEADALGLPFQDAVFAKGLFAAGLHCIRGRAHRLRSLAQLRRVLAPGAPVLVTVWWRDPKRFRGPLRRTQEAVEKQRSSGSLRGDLPALEPGDVSLRWSHGVEQPVERFFHLYEEEELERDLLEAGFQELRVEKVRQGSTWNLIAEARA